ncbi:endo alpha-1,4 polygalactosaminidase [Rhodospira trueperi]|uniref:Glycoside-hydrolase family GH114 TIM-barrel domain-containing protein n=1 Tax=Rhodospira trueperi TaxID=69960 RepID=A0A1G7ATA5_9PROT|nr:endo alpha-1,4 polygalactosaminidase [Rhodospira trueperi]SDE17225.1 cysteinyl-tRNA synthetase, unknown class [Rhodospira trueperi]
MEIDAAILMSDDANPRPALIASAETDPAAARDARRDRLRAVEHWLYLIDVDLEDDVIDRIGASGHDTVVIDYIASEAWNADHPMAETMDRLSGPAGNRLVLAYIDIGQTEDYRTYWRDGWGIGNPWWITALDPDGWEGNYPVAFWAEPYQDIWLADGGLLDGIVEAGFDGVYLDWVEACDDPDVIAAAESDGLEPAVCRVAGPGHLRAAAPGPMIRASRRPWAFDGRGAPGSNCADTVRRPDWRPPSCRV